VRCRVRVVANDNTAPAFTAVFGAGEGEATISASLQALLRCQLVPLELVLGIGERLAVRRVIGPAAKGLVVVNVNLIVEGEECGVLVDGDLVVASTGLRRVSRAGECALVLVKLAAVDRRATEAYSVVLETGISVAVSFAEGNTVLDRGVVPVELTAEAERVGAASVFEAP